MFREIKSEALSIINPYARLIADTEAPLLFSVWLEDEIIGAAEHIGAALRQASDTLIVCASNAEVTCSKCIEHIARKGAI